MIWIFKWIFKKLSFPICANFRKFTIPFEIVNFDNFDVIDETEDSTDHQRRRKSQPYSLAHSSSFTINSLISIQLLVTHVPLPLPPPSPLPKSVFVHRDWRKSVDRVERGRGGGIPLPACHHRASPRSREGAREGAQGGRRRLVDSSCEARCARRG